MRSRCSPLSAITADEYIEFGEAVVHTLSYQQARHYNLPIKGVYVANPGYVFSSAGIPRGALISSFNGKKTDDLAGFRGGAGRSRGRRARAGALRHARGSARGAAEGHPHGPPLVPGAQVQARRRAGDLAVRGRSRRPRRREPQARLDAICQDRRSAHRSSGAVAGAWSTFDMPYSVSGVTEKNYHGTGVIVDAKRGLVVIDRNTVPVAMGDVRITFDGTVEVPGKVVFIHPLHNLAVVSYDPQVDRRHAGACGHVSRHGAAAPATTSGWSASAAIRRSCRRAPRSRASMSSHFPLSRTLRFRDSNLEAVNLINPPGDLRRRTGERRRARCSRSGRVLHSRRSASSSRSTAAFRPISSREMINVVADGRPLYSFEAEFDVQSLAERTRTGLARRVGAALRGTRSAAPAGARHRSSGCRRHPRPRLLEPGDLLLAIDGKVVNRFREVERAVQRSRRSR